jgi:uncharacterized protein (TIGR02271 family)
VHEHLKVGRKRVDSGRVIVKTTTRSDAVRVDEPLEADEVRIERVPVNRFVDAPVKPAFDGDVLVIPVIEEVAVVTKRLRVVEEVRIHRRTVTRRHRETVPLRRQAIEIERHAREGDSDGNRTGRERGRSRTPGRQE